MAQNASTEAQRTPTTLRLIAKTAATAKDSAGTRGPDGDKQGLLLLTTQAGLEMIKVGGAVVGFWFLHGAEQLAHNSQILKKLAVARNWHEALEIQNSFFCDGLSRLNDGMSCYAKEAGRIVARSRQARSGEWAATAHSC